jgi:PEP-CTERM motif-containing protein
MKIMSLALIASAALAAAPAFAASPLLVNDTTGPLVFNRPTEAGDDLSTIGSAVPYFALPFMVDQNGNYNFSATAASPSEFDTFIHLYAGPFSLASPLDNLVFGNDDGVNGSPDLGSAFNGPLLAGNTYTFVVSGFANSDFGAFSASISGPGNITVVPEPSVLALAGLGFLGLGLAFRVNSARRNVNG